MDSSETQLLSLFKEISNNETSSASDLEINQLQNQIKEHLAEVYPNQSIEQDFVQKFLIQMVQAKEIAKKYLPKEENSMWYKEATVYCLYVDLFSNNFEGLTEKLSYLNSLGVSCLWLLPILESPMQDAGFDISNYHQIRKDLGDSTSFKNFLKVASSYGIKVIFDIAINHTSNQHEWFIKSKESDSKDNFYRDWYIWSEKPDKYLDARIIFKGICTSNWQEEKTEYESGKKYHYFHRFFEEQPDLNYRNIHVLFGMMRTFVFWALQGVDGFRADAVPFLWKDENTDCENRPKLHSILKIFRAVLDFVKPGILIIAEACQPPKEVVKYFGINNDESKNINNHDLECQVAYNFPLMPNIYLSLCTFENKYIISILKEEITPKIPFDCQWFTFLRVHDELSLEMVTEEQRSIIHKNYCLEKEWDFREGEGISGRLASLFEENILRIGLAYSIMMTLIGTPIIFYGDEFAKKNDTKYFQDMLNQTGIRDTRYYVRGRINWEKYFKKISNENTISSKVFNILKKQIEVRNKYKSCFGQGDLNFIQTDDISFLIFIRTYKDEVVLCIHNLKKEKNTLFLKETEIQKIHSSFLLDNFIKNLDLDLLGQKIDYQEKEKEGIQLNCKDSQYNWFVL